MNEDELMAPPVSDTIALLVKAGHRCGFDVEPNGLEDLVVEVGRRSIGRHVQALVVASLAILAATITFESSTADEGAVVMTIVALTCASLVGIYGRSRRHAGRSRRPGR